MTRISRYGRIIITTISVALLALACEEEEPADISPIVGQWILTQMTVTATAGDTSVTDSYIVIDIGDAFIMDFDEATYDIHSDDPCTAGWESESDYSTGLTYTVREDNFIVLNRTYHDPEDNSSYNTSEPIEYALEGENLTLILRDVDLNTEIVQQMEFDLYTGDIPPTEWSVSLAADSYEPDTTLATATTLVIGAAEQTHTLPLNDFDIFVMDADSGQTYVIETTGTMDTYLSLYDSVGATLLTENDDAGDAFNARILWTCDATGAYTLRANAWDPDEECGTYAISASIASTTKRMEGPRIDKALWNRGLFRRR